MNKSSNGRREWSAYDRRKYIEEKLKEASGPLTAANFSKELSVSRQIIVSDVAILRASGLDILATPKGYIIEPPEKKEDFPFIGMLACRHTAEQLRDELYTMVDFGATVIDVVIEHAIYGEISGNLSLSSRYDVDQFIKKVENEKNSAPISSLTGGAHLHRIGCKDQAAFEMIKATLNEKGILIK